MIALQAIVDLIVTGSGLTADEVQWTEAEVDTETLTSERRVVVGRGKHEGGQRESSSVCDQRMISRIVVFVEASDLPSVRNPVRNALIGQYLPEYQAELLYEEGDLTGVNGNIAGWLDTYRVDWRWEQSMRNEVNQ